MKHCSPEDIGLGNLTWQEVRSKMDVCGGAFGYGGSRKRPRMEDREMDMMGGMGMGNGGVSLQEFIMLQVKTCIALCFVYLFIWEQDL